ALLAGEVHPRWQRRHPFLAHNARFLERVGLLEARVRRGDLVDPEALYAFFDERLGPDVTSTRHFDTWWRARTDAGDSADLLDYTPAVLGSRSGIRLADYPDTWRFGDREYAVTYR